MSLIFDRCGGIGSPDSAANEMSGGGGFGLSTLSSDSNMSLNLFRIMYKPNRSMDLYSYRQLQMILLAGAKDCRAYTQHIRTSG